MKKILIIILIVLLGTLAYHTIFEGLTIGNTTILSAKQIMDKNDQLTKEISNIETLMHSSYPAKKEELNKSIETMKAAKEEYEDLASISTEGELSQANKEETYKQQFLWTKIGRYATQEGVTLTFSITSGNTGNPQDKNLLFDVSGSYFAIVNFISAIEDDNELNFRIEDFKMVPGSDQNNRQATFNAKNVRIEQDNIQSPAANEQFNTTGANSNLNQTPSTSSTPSTNPTPSASPAPTGN